MCSPKTIDEILEEIDTIPDIKELRRLLDKIQTHRTYSKLELQNLVEHIKQHCRTGVPHYRQGNRETQNLLDNDGR